MTLFRKLNCLSINLSLKSIGCNRTVNSAVLSSNHTVHFVHKRSKSDEQHKQSQDQTGKWLMLIFPVTGLMLGTWQVRRKQWKLNLIKALDEKTNSDPISLPLNLDELTDLEYRPVIVKGAFLHSNEVYVEPRHLIEKEKKISSGGSLVTFHGGNVGAQVITPFFIPDRGYAILVNRGFVPREKKDPKERLEGQVDGLVEVKGIIRRSEKRSVFAPKHKPESKIWNFKDIDEISKTLNTSPVLIDAVDTIPGGPIGGQTRVTLRDEHIQYALTWYSLAFILGVMWYYRYIHQPVI